MKLKKGINLPVSGQPKQTIISVDSVKQFAIRGVVDFHGLKPFMQVKVGDKVKMGQPIFQNKDNVKVVFPSPVSGTVSAINRGYRRCLESVVIDSDGKDTPYKTLKPVDVNTSREDVLSAVLDSGHFSAFKSRPFSKVPDPDIIPDAIFITAMDTNPLAVDAGVVIKEFNDLFKAGVDAISKLTTGNTYVCCSSNTVMPAFTSGSVTIENFDGVHPAGNVGTHIHFLRPVSMNKMVWTINYQDVINIGAMAKDGTLQYDKIISVAGPAFKEPALYKTRIGADIMAILGGKEAPNSRIVNGSILTGDAIRPETAFVGFTTTQISVMSAKTDSRTLGWLIPWADKFSSILNVHFSSFSRKKLQNFDSGLNGSYRSIIPLGHFEKLTPLDILPTHLMRAVLIGDTEMAQKLGILELDEEDIALFSYADIGKNDFLGAFRNCLDKIEKEG